MGGPNGTQADVLMAYARSHSATTSRAEHALRNFWQARGAERIAGSPRALAVKRRPQHVLPEGVRLPIIFNLKAGCRFKFEHARCDGRKFVETAGSSMCKRMRRQIAG